MTPPLVEVESRHCRDPQTPQIYARWRPTSPYPTHSLHRPAVSRGLSTGVDLFTGIPAFDDSETTYAYTQQCHPLEGTSRGDPTPQRSLAYTDCYQHDHPPQRRIYEAIHPPHSSSFGPLRDNPIQSSNRRHNQSRLEGAYQLLCKVSQQTMSEQDGAMPYMPISLYAEEQDDIFRKTNDRLSECAFNFFARHQFPIPLEKDKRPVRIPADREWTEWVYLIKELATKRRSPSHVIYNGQIKQLVTVLESSLEMRHAAKHQSRPLRDDRNVFQIVSAGIQVAKALKDASVTGFLDRLYTTTESTVQERQSGRTLASRNPVVGTVPDREPTNTVREPYSIGLQLREQALPFAGT